MKFKCKICGQQIDNPYICPYCGSGSDHIILIDEEEELKEEVTEEKLGETYEDESSYETNFNEENKDQEIDDNSSNISSITEAEETSNQNPNDSKLEEEDIKTLVENDQKVLDLEKKPAEFEYFLKIYGYLYLNNLDLASKFKNYFDHYLLEKSLEAVKDFTEEDFKNFTSENDFLNKIMQQFKL